MNKCDLHENEVKSLFCWTCDKSICKQCSQNEHAFHQSAEIAQHSVDRKCVVKTGKRIEDEHLCQMEVCIKHIQNVRKDNKTKMATKLHRIEEQKHDLITTMTSLFEQLTKEAKEELEKNNSELDKMETKFSSHISKFKQKTSSLQRNSSRFSSSTIETEQKEIQTMIEEMKSMTHETISCYGKLSIFVKGNIDVSILGKMIGKSQDIKDLKTTAISDFTFGDKTIASISPIAEEEAWIHGISEDQSTLTTLKGERKRRIRYGSSFGESSVLEKGDHFFNDFKMQCIKKLTPSGLVSIVKDTKPYTPLGISLMEDIGLLVTLSSDDLEHKSEDGRSLVWHMTLTGRVMKEYEFEQDGTTPLFVCPYRATQNLNSDICIVDMLTKNTGRVVVIRKEGALKFRYNGIESQQKSFDPSMICCDANSNILVSDYSNDYIHILTADGQFVKYLLTSNDGVVKPYSLAIYNNILWIGCREGMVKVVRHHVTKDMRISYGLDAVAKNSIDFEMIKVINSWKNKDKEENDVSTM